jgi:hypothetical protein
MTILESTKLNQEVFKNIEISSHENMIMKSQEKFYENFDNISLFFSIVNSKSKISIRLIDHFITKYSKVNKISFKLKENNIEQIFNIHSSYKQQLKAYQKRNFDPFSRGDRIPYFMNDSCIITTIGQLNFFKWFISKKIYDYMIVNHDLIENDMNKKTKIDNTQKPNKIKKNTTNFKKYQNQTKISKYKTKRMANTNEITVTEQKIDKIVVSFSF